MTRDPHSFSDLTQGATRHLHLELAVDFATRTLSGTAKLAFVNAIVGPLDLDTSGLDVLEALDDQDQPVPFELADAHPVYGSRLRVHFARASEHLTIRYRTSPDATGLMWLDPEQTDSGAHPFLLSQCQAIHARSLTPVQDTPRGRITYSARITVPAELTAVMSAAPGTAEVTDAGRVFAFEMPQPIPPYLLALAVGELEFRDLGPRCRVFAEPGVVERAAWEFTDIERMLTVAEGLFGPYEWNRYDFVVLPPSFPMGGMENPRMTFLTPTLLAGDRSLVGVLAHELAHSWTGNLVSNADNEHFWLNEGWTVWAERRILEALYGTEVANQESILGRAGLESVIAERAAAGRPTALTYAQAGLDPDEEFSKIPYEKGFLLVTALERAVGRERFDAFVRDYIARFQFQSITTDTFIGFVNEQLPGHGIDLAHWVTAPGIPDDAPAFHSARLDELTALARAHATVAGEDWTTTEKLHFMAHLPAGTDARRVAVELGIDDRSNDELKSAWLALSLRSEPLEDTSLLVGFLDRVGRTKLIKPVYKAMASSSLRALAQSTYASNRARLHSSTRQTLDAALGVDA